MAAALLFRELRRIRASFLDETFLENEEGDQFLDSTTIAEVIEADVWPLPPYLVPVLTSIRIHDDVRVYSTYSPDFSEIDDFTSLLGLRRMTRA